MNERNTDKTELEREVSGILVQVRKIRSAIPVPGPDSNAVWPTTGICVHTTTAHGYIRESLSPSRLPWLRFLRRIANKEPDRLPSGREDNENLFWPYCLPPASKISKTTAGGKSRCLPGILLSIHTLVKVGLEHGEWTRWRLIHFRYEKSGMAGR